MVNAIKEHVPRSIKKVIRRYQTNIRISNLFRTNYKKTALLSYIVAPFKKKDSLTHTNYYEAQSWAKILFELGYNVDIIHFENTKKLNLVKYDLICGFGDVFQYYFETKYLHAKTIYYATGMHVCHQNNASLSRVKDVYKKKGVWLVKSARFVEKTWTHQTTLVDGIIALGNDVCAQSYQKYYDNNVYSVLAPFYKVLNAKEIIENRKPNFTKSFLWFGSSGLIHKGLDIVLEFFVSREDLTLHICGPIENEKDFVEVYKNELYSSSNIFTHGFVNLTSDKFKDILTRTSFIIFPSCSEGGAASVLTAIGNGGLIPIISKETTISTGNEIWIEELTVEGIGKSINIALSLSEQKIKNMQVKNLDYIQKNHSKEKYYNTLKNSIESVIKKSNEI